VVLRLSFRAGFWLDACDEASTAPNFSRLLTFQLFSPHYRIIVIPADEVASPTCHSSVIDHYNAASVHSISCSKMKRSAKRKTDVLGREIIARGRDRDEGVAAPNRAVRWSDLVHLHDCN